MWQCGCGAIHSDNEVECPFQDEGNEWDNWIFQWLHEEDEDYDDVFENDLTDEEDEELSRRERKGVKI